MFNKITVLILHILACYSLLGLLININNNNSGYEDIVHQSLPKFISRTFLMAIISYRIFYCKNGTIRFCSICGDLRRFLWCRCGSLVIWGADFDSDDHFFIWNCYCWILAPRLETFFGKFQLSYIRISMTLSSVQAGWRFL